MVESIIEETPGQTESTQSEYCYRWLNYCHVPPPQTSILVRDKKDRRPNDEKIWSDTLSMVLMATFFSSRTDTPAEVKSESLSLRKEEARIKRKKKKITNSLVTSCFQGETSHQDPVLPFVSNAFVGRS